jgi:hypothetical protein
LRGRESLQCLSYAIQFRNIYKNVYLQINEEILFIYKTTGATEMWFLRRVMKVLYTARISDDAFLKIRKGEKKLDLGSEKGII